MTIFDAPVPADLTPEEIGHAGGMQPAWHHQLGPGYVATGFEENPDLEFPESTAIYDRMRKTNGQVAALLRAINHPIIGTKWSLASEGVPPEIVTFVETELGLGEDDNGNPIAYNVRWRDHLREALLALPFGFMPFERVYQVGAPYPEQIAAGIDTDLVAHLHKLAPRLPRTLQEVRVTQHGDLAGVLQAGIGWDASKAGAGVRIIGNGRDQVNDEAERYLPRGLLAYYCFEREGADWTGSSILRAAYEAYMIRTQLVRVDAIAGERNGMGVPVVYYNGAAGGNRGEARNIAASFRAGAAAGGALEDGQYRLELVTPNGQPRDVLASIRYHDQAISRSALAMFLDLGHDGGLGHGGVADTFHDLFVDSLGYVCGWIEETTTAEVIRDLVTNTFGVGAPCPRLKAEPPSAQLTAEALKALADARIITPDPDLENDRRRHYGLPEKPDLRVTGTPGDDDSPQALDPLAEEPGQIVRDAADEAGFPIAGANAYLARVESALKRIEVLRAEQAPVS